MRSGHLLRKLNQLTCGSGLHQVLVWHLGVFSFLFFLCERDAHRNIYSTVGKTLLRAPRRVMGSRLVLGIDKIVPLWWASTA